MSAITLVLFALGVAASAPQSQTRPQASEPLTFSSDVRMIRLDVSVVDGGGRPIRGLVAENFSILENGKPVEVSVFEAIEDGSLATMAASEDGGPASLAVLAQGPLSHSPGQRIVIVADPSDLTPMQLARVREATSDFIAKQAKDGDIVRMINLATREVWEGRIPDDRLRLASIGKVMSRRRSPFFRPGGAGESLGEQIEFDMEDDVNGAYTESLRRERFQSRFARTGELLSLFDEILIQLAAIPGRKSLILISDGFPQLRLMDERLERTAHLAREAQAAIHFIDAYGLDGLLPEPGQKMESIFDKAWNRSGGSQDLAQATGGFVSRFANVLTSAVSRAAEEARSYYIVGYAPTRRDDGKFRSVKVRVDREDATVRTKKGYIAGGVSSGLVSRRVH